MSAAQPIAGMPIKAPDTPPAAGEVVVRYEVRKPETGCCKCQGLSQTGLILVIVLAIVFWPCAFIICCMPSMFEDYQVPVYGKPGSAPAEVAVPVAETVPPDAAEPAKMPSTKAEAM